MTLKFICTSADVGSRSRRVRWAVLLPAVFACAGRTIPPVSQRADPRAHAVHLVAFHAVLPRVLVFEPPDRLVTLAVRERFSEPFAALAPPLARRLAGHRTDPGAVLAILRASEMAAHIEAAGYTWPRPHVEPTLALSDGRLALAGTRVQVQDHAHTLTVAMIPPDPVRVLWWLDAKERWLALSVCYDGAVAACDLRAFSRDALAARLVSARAYAAHTAGNYTEAARTFAEALALDPAAADAAYNLACAHARLAQIDPALAALNAAITGGGARYRALARSDPDLAALRELPEVQDLILETD